MQFTVTQGPDGTTIDQPLPLDVYKLYRYSRNSTHGRGIIGSDMLGNKLIFSLEYGEDYDSPDGPQSGWFDELWVIEDVSACIEIVTELPDTEIDERCAERILAVGPDRHASSPVWGLTSDRVYFSHGWSIPGGSALGFLDRIAPGAAWSAPGMVSIEAIDGPGLRGGSAALLSFGEVLNQYADDALHFLQIGSACTAANASTQSCFSQGTAVVVMNFDPHPFYGKWTTHGILDAGPNLMYFDSDANSIREFDPDTSTSIEIIGGLPDRVTIDPVD